MHDRLVGELAKREVLVGELDALVIPAFETKLVHDASTAVAQSRATVAALVAAGKAEGFHVSRYAKGHSATDFKRWLELDNAEAYQAPHVNGFEPYVVVKRNSLSLPRYDDRFRGYGLNKVVHCVAMARAGYVGCHHPRLSHHRHHHHRRHRYHRDHRHHSPPRTTFDRPTTIHDLPFTIHHPPPTHPPTHAPLAPPGTRSRSRRGPRRWWSRTSTRTLTRTRRRTARTRTLSRLSAYRHSTTSLSASSSRTCILPQRGPRLRPRLRPLRPSTQRTQRTQRRAL